MLTGRTHAHTTQWHKSIIARVCRNLVVQNAIHLIANGWCRSAGSLRSLVCTGFHRWWARVQGTHTSQSMVWTMRASRWKTLLCGFRNFRNFRIVLANELTRNAVSSLPMCRCRFSRWRHRCRNQKLTWRFDGDATYACIQFKFDWGRRQNRINITRTLSRNREDSYVRIIRLFLSFCAVTNYRKLTHFRWVAHPWNRRFGRWLISLVCSTKTAIKT